MTAELTEEAYGCDHRVTASSWSAFALFTDRARMAIVCARHYAGTSDLIGPAHLLLGMLGDLLDDLPIKRERTPGIRRSHLLIGLRDECGPGGVRLLGVTCDDGSSAEKLRNAGLPVVEVWSLVADVASAVREVCVHHTAFTTDVANILHGAMAMAAQLGHDRVNTRHILLALTDCRATMVLQLGVDPDKLRAELMAALSSKGWNDDPR